MSELIVVALIGLVSAVTVALINSYALIRTKTETSHKKTKLTSSEITVPRFKFLGENEKRWIMIMFILVPWLIYSPYTWGIELGIINLIALIPVITIILSFVTPIKPITAIFSVLAIHPINLYITDFPLSKAMANPPTTDSNSPLEPFVNSLMNENSAIWILFTIIVNILLVYAICRYRVKRGYKK